MRILLLSTKQQDVQFFGAVAKSMDVPLVHCESPAQLCGELLKNPTAITIVDASTQALYKAFETTLSERVGLFSSNLNSNCIVAIIAGPIHDAGFMLKNDIVGHFLHRNYTAVDASLVASLLKKSSKEKAFGLEHFFAKATKIQNLKVTQSLQKRAIVESLKTNLLGLGFKQRMATVICAAADELIMNAVFDAPMDEMGRHIYARTPRNADIKLAGKAVVDVKLAFDGSLLGISVTDNHGSLDKKKMLNQHMAKSYEANEYETRSLTAGAGLGLSHVYRTCGGMVLTCETGERTEVTLFYRKAESFKQFKDQFRFLSTFMYFS